MSSGNALEVANLSDTGLRRRHNEDSTASDHRTGLLVLADGMGGYLSGEVASAIAVSYIVNEIARRLAQDGRPKGMNGYSWESLAVQRAIKDANALIYRTGRDEPQCSGMGTTVVAVWFHGDRVSVGHVGDSRCYRLRNGLFEQITSDHSMAQELIEQGLLSPEQASLTVPKNLVTRALGIAETVDIDLHEEQVSPGDLYLMCSDGLYDMLANEEIHLTLRKYSDNLAQAAGQLVAMANERGGHDNISVILARPGGA